MLFLQCQVDVAEASSTSSHHLHADTSAPSAPLAIAVALNGDTYAKSSGEETHVHQGHAAQPQGAAHGEHFMAIDRSQRARLPRRINLTRTTVDSLSTVWKVDETNHSNAIGPFDSICGESTSAGPSTSTSTSSLIREVPRPLHFWLCNYQYLHFLS